MSAAAPPALRYVPAVETHLIESSYVSQTFKIEVMQPSQPRDDTSQYPVVYATDGNWCFDMLKGLSHLLHLAPTIAPMYTLVAIGYPGDSPHAGMRLRARDLVGPPYPDLDPSKLNPLPHEGVLLPEEGTKETNGAADFKRFINDELIPFVDSTYRTIPGDRTYFGHSGGAYFGLFDLVTGLPTFRNYIISSPGLVWDGPWWGSDEYLKSEFGLEMIREFATRGEALDDTRVYISAGADEELEEGVSGWQITSGILRLAKVFRDAAIPGLQIMLETFPGEGHITCWPVAFVHGVQAVYGTRHVPSVVDQRVGLTSAVVPGSSERDQPVG